jgi:aminoglycoside 6'-N-acetyltransferase
MRESPYTFRPVEQRDLPLLRTWLCTPEVMLWWGDPEAEYALLQEDLNDPRMVMRIISHAGQPFAYAQDYEVRAWPQAHLSGLPMGARAIDAFIGTSDMIGRGHGTAFLRLLAKRLRSEGAPVVVVDPKVDNRRARRAYEGAGFSGDVVVETDTGLVILLTFRG